MPSRKILNHIRSLPQVHCYFIYYFFIFSLFFSRILAMYAKACVFLRSSYREETRVAHSPQFHRFSYTPKGFFFFFLFYIISLAENFFLRIYILYHADMLVYNQKRKFFSFLPLPPTLELSSWIYKRESPTNPAKQRILPGVAFLIAFHHFIWSGIAILHTNLEEI